MKHITYELLNHRIELPEIQSDYFEQNQVYYCIEQTPEGFLVSFFNPEFAFEKQKVINCDASKVFSYLNMPEEHPQEYQQFQQDGFVFVRTDSTNVSLFAMHSLKAAR